MKLTKQQMSYFETFGYLICRQLFPPSEIAEITREADELWRQMRKEGEDKGSHQDIAPFIEHRPRLMQLADDDRIYEPMQQLLGDDFIWVGSEGRVGSFNDTNDHRWHCDRTWMYGLNYRWIKHMIYLEPTTKDTGALRVIPGSHLREFAEILHVLNEERPNTCRDIFGVEGDEMPCVALESDPGDMVILNHYIFHGVYHKQPNRRYISLKFAEKPTRPEHFDALCQHVQGVLHETFRNSKRTRIQTMIKPIITMESRSATYENPVP